MRVRAFAGVVVCLLAPLALAGGVEVFLNGVQVTGARDQVIENAKVELDSSGNVRITAPEYQVREVGGASGTSRPPAAQATAARLTKKYFVISEVKRPLMTGYEIQVIVNDKFLRSIADDIPQYVLELNNYLKEGANTVSFRALRPQGKSAQSTLASDSFSVVLGEGHGEEGGTLTIDNVLGEFMVTAIDRGEKAQTFSIKAQ